VQPRTKQHENEEDDRQRQGEAVEEPRQPDGSEAVSHRASRARGKVTGGRQPACRGVFAQPPQILRLPRRTPTRAWVPWPGTRHWRLAAQSACLGIARSVRPRPSVLRGGSASWYLVSHSRKVAKVLGVVLVNHFDCHQLAGQQLGNASGPRHAVLEPIPFAEAQVTAI